jgi:hypothetical protein
MAKRVPSADQLNDFSQLMICICVREMTEYAIDLLQHCLVPIWQLQGKCDFGLGLPEWLLVDLCTKENVTTSDEFSVSGFPAA